MALPSRLKNIAWMLFGRNSYLMTTGWYKSATSQQVVNRLGMPVPWLTYSAQEFLSDRLGGSMRVLEYGAGNSSLWLAKKCFKVVSIEHDTEWATRIQNEAPANLEIVQISLPFTVEYEKHAFSSLPQDNNYINPVELRQNKWDVVLIDGIFRNACCRTAVDRVSETGVIVVDNTDFEEFEPGRSFLRAKNYREIGFGGLAPVAARGSKTSIFYRNQNVLEI